MPFQVHGGNVTGASDYVLSRGQSLTALAQIIYINENKNAP